MSEDEGGSVPEAPAEEAETVIDVSAPVEETPVGEPAAPPPAGTPASIINRLMTDKKLAALFIVGIVILAGVFAVSSGMFDDDGSDSSGSDHIDGNVSMPLNILEPVWLERELTTVVMSQDNPDGVIGYEPSLAID